MAEVRDAVSERTIEVALMFERGERYRRRGHGTRFLRTVEPRAGRKVIEDRLTVSERAERPCEPQIVRAEIDEHDEVDGIATQAERVTEHVREQRRDATERRDRAEARPAGRPRDERDARGFHPFAADPGERRVRFELAHRGRERCREHVARGLARREERAHYFRMPRSDGPSTNASKYRPSSLETNERIASIACEML